MIHTTEKMQTEPASVRELLDGDVAQLLMQRDGVQRSHVESLMQRMAKESQLLHAR